MFKTAQEAINDAKAKAESSGDYIDFVGMNCNDYISDDRDECDGWDGVSYRCSCGNRRVSWETYGDEKVGFVAFACAN